MNRCEEFQKIFDVLRPYANFYHIEDYELKHIVSNLMFKSDLSVEESINKLVSELDNK